MGIYTKVMKGLPKLPKHLDNASHGSKVAAAKVDIIQKASGEARPEYLAAYYRECRLRKEALEEELSKVQVLLDAHEELLVAALDEAGMTGLTLSGGDAVRSQPEPYVTTEDKARLMAWVKKNEMDAYLSLPWQTLNAIAKEILLEGGTIPDGTKLWVRDKIVFTKFKAPTTEAK